MNHKSIGPLILIAAIAGGLLVVLLIRDRNPVPADSGDRVFRMNLSNEPPTLDWSLATDSVSFTVITNLMEGLTEFDENLDPRPAVAERWEVSPDGKTYTFHLSAESRWSDGRPVTAEDFVYSWRRLLDPKTASQYAYFLYDVENAYAFNTGQLTDSSRVGVRAISDRTLQVVLRKPLVYFPGIATYMVTFPQRKDVIEEHGDLWTEPGNIVTNGPFKLAEWRHEYKLRLDANPEYREGRPSLDRIDLYVINDPTTALTLYETGDLEMANLPPEAIASYENSPDHRRHPLLRGNYYSFNVHRAPFDDVRVRKAFAMAVDREELTRVLKGGEIPATSWIPPGMFAHDPSIGLPYDPVEARRLLAEAGYPEGRGWTPVTAVFNTSPVNALVAENLQAQWKRTLNVRIDLDNMEWKVYLSLLETRAPHIFRLSWGADYPDPDNFMSLFTGEGGNNRTGWKNPGYDVLVGRASSETDAAKRRELYDRAQRLLLEEEVPIIPLFFSVQNVLVSPAVQGLRLNAMELLYLKSVSLSEGPSPLEKEPFSAPTR